MKSNLNEATTVLKNVLVYGIPAQNDAADRDAFLLNAFIHAQTISELSNKDSKKFSVYTLLKNVVGNIAKSAS